MNAELKPEQREMINSFVNELGHLMAVERPYRDFLNNWLIKRLSMLHSRNERLGLLCELIKLNSSKIIDVYYLGTIQSFFSLIQDHIKNESSAITSLKKRSLADIALQYVWEGKIITNQNKDEIAKSFPELKLKNGNKLIQKYYYYNSKSNRIGDRGDLEKNKRHLILLEKTIKCLQIESDIKYAEKEINTFKKNVKEVSGQTL